MADTSTASIDLAQLDSLEALAQSYLNENSGHWYSSHQLADGITLESAATFIAAANPATVQQLIALARRSLTSGALAELLNAEELAALRRFNETCEDGEGYDVPKEMMKRLAEIGVIYRRSGAYYQFTEFGMLILGAPAHIVTGVSDIRRADSLAAGAAAKTEQDDGCFAWAVFAENGNVIIWSRQRSQVEPVAAKYGRPVVPVISLPAAAAGAGSAQPAALSGSVLRAMYEAFQRGDSVERAHATVMAIVDAALTQQAGAAAPSLDPVVEANRELLLKRSNVGIEKYGVTLAGAGLNRAQIVQHALEEALDLANYLQTLLQSENDAKGETP